MDAFCHLNFFCLLFEAGDQTGAKSDHKEGMQGDAANADSGNSCWRVNLPKKAVCVCDGFCLLVTSA